MMAGRKRRDGEAGKRPTPKPVLPVGGTIKASTRKQPGGESSKSKAIAFTPETRSFRAVLEPDHTSLKWVIARVPFDTASTWARMIRLRVRGEINGTPFRTSLFPTAGGHGGQVLLVNKTMQRAAGVSVGQAADFTLEPDLEERPAELPEDLKRAFAGDRALLRWAEALSESTRREIGKWLGGVKSPEARAQRVEQLAERLLLAMEGEAETPPILEAAFNRQPRARKAWKALTVAQRRGHLLGIFYYQTPEARQRRAEKAVEFALCAADRSASK